MLIQKRHALDHLCEAISSVCAIESLHTSVRGIPKQFKALYALGSRKKRSAMDEVVAMPNSESPKDFYTFPILHCAEKEVTDSAREPCRMDSTVLPRFGGRRRLLAFESMMSEMGSREDERVERIDEYMAAWELRKIMNH